ncbi:hypothetical protein Zmor_009915 [Zophobas morio]|uniref:Uncharacterized protein n=1 Tax=Zophobas morio TaxID=2755281 RepID=A0AA38IJN5_9CUCU|nr:hypothetical protein Zmor_009915 [Zophobas morio]
MDWRRVHQAPRQRVSREDVIGLPLTARVPAFRNNFGIRWNCTGNRGHTLRSRVSSCRRSCVSKGHHIIVIFVIEYGAVVDRLFVTEKVVTSTRISWIFRFHNGDDASGFRETA